MLTGDSSSYRRDYAQSQQAATSSAASNKKPRTGGLGTKKWSHNCDGSIFLERNFRRFKDTAGKAGFDYNLTSPTAINQIYEENAVFRDYIKKRFSVNYIATAAKFKTNLEKEGTRALRRSSKYFFYV